MYIPPLGPFPKFDRSTTKRVPNTERYNSKRSLQDVSITNLFGTDTSDCGDRALETVGQGGVIHTVAYGTVHSFGHIAYASSPGCFNYSVANTGMATYFGSAFGSF